MKNKIGIYYAYWTKDWDVDFTGYLNKVSSLGFDVMEINSDSFIRMPKEARLELARKAENYNLELTFCVGLGNQYDLAVEDSTIRRRGIECLKETIEKIAEIGGNKLSGIIYSAWNPLSFPADESDKKAFLERSVVSMKEVAVAAENYGVYCNLEVVNRFEQFILNTCKEAVDYVKMVGSPNIKILLDSYHMNIEEDNFREAVITAGKRLGHLHIGENNRKPPGQGGHLNWQELFSALEEIDYTGYIVMEPFVRQGGEVGRDIKVWRNLKKAEDMDQEVKQALEFVKGFMK